MQPTTALCLPVTSHLSKTHVVPISVPSKVFATSFFGKHQPYRKRMNPHLPAPPPKDYGYVSFVEGRGVQFESIVDDCTRRGSNTLSPRAYSVYKCLRPFSRIEVNPRDISAQQLVDLMSMEQSRSLIQEYEDLGYGMCLDAAPPTGLPNPLPAYKFDTAWHTAQRQEGQILVLVIFDPNQPVGFATLHTELNQTEGQKGCVYNFMVRARMFYVTPSRRREALGLDLSIACSQLVGSLYRAVSARLSVHAQYAACLEGEFDTRGGRRFKSMLQQTLDRHSETLQRIRHPVSFAAWRESLEQA